jgi:catechol 2,3-dioxygenase-like lactoylglutathione lyase family enzyme
VATAPIKPIFAPTGWKTVALDHILFSVADYKKEAAFYAAVMGWTLRSDDGKQAVMDMGDWGSVIFRQAAPGTPGRLDAPANPTPSASTGRGRGGRGAPVTAVVESFCSSSIWDRAASRRIRVRD